MLHNKLDTKLQGILTKMKRFLYIYRIYFLPTPISLGRMDIKSLPFKFDVTSSMTLNLLLSPSAPVVPSPVAPPGQKRGQGWGREVWESSHQNPQVHNQS